MAQFVQNGLKGPIHPLFFAPFPAAPRTAYQHASQLSDNFDDNSLSPAWTIGQIVSGAWTTTGCTVAETNQRIEATLAAGVTNRGDGIVSTATYDFTNDSIFVKIPNIASIQTGEAVRLTFGVLGNNFSLQTDSTGNMNLEPTAGTGTRGTDVWFRLRHDAATDTVKVDTAPSTAGNPPIPADWVNRISVARTSSMLLTGQIALSVGANGTSPATPTVFQFDGFNTATTNDVTAVLSGQSVNALLGSTLAATDLPLTGCGVVAAQGSATNSATIALTGQSISVARGTVVAAPSLAITGQSLSLSQGSIVASPGIALSGQSASVSRGSVLAATSPALTGNAATTAQGSLTGALSTALTGQGLTAAQGAVVVGASDVTAALTGQAVASSLGSLSPSLSVAGSGQSATASSGSVTGALSPALAGQVVGVSQDAFMLVSSTALTGKEIGVGQFAALLAETMNEPKFWNPPPLTGRRMSVSRSR